MASEEDFKEAYLSLVSDVASTVSMENALGGKGPLKVPKPRGRNKRSKGHAGEAPVPRDPLEITRTVLEECNKQRKRAVPASKEDTSDAALSKIARFTDKFNLVSYAKFLYYVPRLVNVSTGSQCLTTARSLTRAVCRQVVTLAETIPVPGSGITLPLDLHRIAARCKNSYYAPKKFSAVQLAYNEPRCRVLVFRKPHGPAHTLARTSRLPCLSRRYWKNGGHRYAASHHPFQLRASTCARSSVHRLQRTHGRQTRAHARPETALQRRGRPHPRQELLGALESNMMIPRPHSAIYSNPWVFYCVQLLAQLCHLASGDQPGKPYP